MKQKNYHGDSGRCDGDVTVVKKTWPPVMSREGPIRPRRFCDTARCLVGTRYCRLTCKCRNRISDNRPITTSNRMFLFFFVVRPARTIPNAFWPRSGSGKEEFLPRRRLGVFLGQGQSRAAQSRLPASVASTFGASGRPNLSPPGPSRLQKTWTVNARMFQSQPGLPPEASGPKDGLARARCTALHCKSSIRAAAAGLKDGCRWERGVVGPVVPGVAWRAPEERRLLPRYSPVLAGRGREEGDRGSGSADEGGMCCLLASVSVTEWKRHGF